MTSKRMSVVMIARNAENQIEASLKSVDWADELCVADTGSSDNTKELARECGAKTASISFEGFGPARQKAVAMTSHDWVLSLDSDEVVTSRLKHSLKLFLESSDAYDGAEFSRVTNFCGHWILHSGWYPEYVLRLFDKRKANFNDKLIHESVGPVEKIKRVEGHLLHFSYPELKIYLDKIKEYSRLKAEADREVAFLKKLLFLLIKPGFVFVKKFVLQRGFADGLPGLWIACLSAYGQVLRYLYGLTQRH